MKLFTYSEITLPKPNEIFACVICAEEYDDVRIKAKEGCRAKEFYQFLTHFEDELDKVFGDEGWVDDCDGNGYTVRIFH